MSKETIKQTTKPIEQPQEDDEESSISLKWPWYLLMTSCFLEIFGVALTWILIKEQILSNSIFLPSLICSIISIVLLVLFFYYDTTNFSLAKYHVPQKIFTMYFLSLMIFCLAVIFSILFICFYNQIIRGISTEAFFIICIAVVCVLTLIATGLCRYAKYKIDLTIFQRKHGIDATKKEQEEKQTPIDSFTSASSGLADAIEK